MQILQLSTKNEFLSSASCVEWWLQIPLLVTIHPQDTAPKHSFRHNKPPGDNTY